MLVCVYVYVGAWVYCVLLQAYGMGGGADGASGEGGGGDSGHYPVGPPYESGRGEAT